MARDSALMVVEAVMLRDGPMATMRSSVMAASATSGAALLPS